MNRLGLKEHPKLDPLQVLAGWKRIRGGRQWTSLTGIKPSIKEHYRFGRFRFWLVPPRIPTYFRGRRPTNAVGRPFSGVIDPSSLEWIRGRPLHIVSERNGFVPACPFIRPFFGATDNRSKIECIIGQIQFIKVIGAATTFHRIGFSQNFPRRGSTNLF